MRAAGDDVRGRYLIRQSVWLVACVVILGLSLAACGQNAAPPPKFSGGVYTNAQFHFRVSYPQGWKVNVQPSPSGVVPLTIYITRSDAVSTPGAPVSTLTIAVFDAHNKDIAASIKSLAGDAKLRKITLAGQAAFQSAPAQQSVPDSTTITDTHTDYYLVTPNWEYQISTDAISGESADSALTSMVQSFTLVK